MRSALPIAPLLLALNDEGRGLVGGGGAAPGKAAAIPGAAAPFDSVALFAKAWM